MKTWAAILAGLVLSGCSIGSSRPRSSYPGDETSIAGGYANGSPPFPVSAEDPSYPSPPSPEPVAPPPPAPVTPESTYPRLHVRGGDEDDAGWSLTIKKADNRPSRAEDQDPAAQMEYCGLLGRAVTAAMCQAYGNTKRYSVPARASLSAPPYMYRGQKGTVRFAVLQGADQAAANILVSGPGGTTRPVAPARFGQQMEAQLTGEGFVISPTGAIKANAQATGEALWTWTIMPVRAPNHYLHIEGWVLRPDDSGKLVRAEPIHHPDIIVDVPIRWFPEWVHDVMDDSMVWMGGSKAWLTKGTNWVEALGLFVGALAGLWAGLRAFRGRRAGGEPEIPAG